MVEMAELPDGLWRFGLPTTDLLDWRKLKQAAHLSPETKRTLEMTARALGARRELWYGSFEPIELAVCRAQRFSVEADEWRDALRLVEP